MKIFRKKIIVISICLILISIIFSGCISVSDVVPPDKPSKHPTDAVITMDNDGNIYFLWRIYSSGRYYLLYDAIDKNGTKLIEKEVMTERFMTFPKIIKDSNGFFHFFYVGLNESLGYLKINNKFEIIINKTIVSELFNGEKGSFDTSKLYDVAIDKYDNLHILWFITNFKTSYQKLSSTGEVLGSRNLGKFITNITKYLGMVDFSFYSTINTNNIIWTIWASAGNTYDTKTNVIEGVNKILSGSAIKTDSLGNIYIRSGKYVKKIDSNGTFLFKENLSDLRVIPDYPVIEGEDGNYIYLGENGCIDSNNNFHIVTERVETKSGIGRDEYDYHTIYYSKIGKNGTVIIDNMIIDSDDDSNLEKTKDAIEFVILSLLIAVPVVFIIIIILKFKKSNKTRRKNINQNQKKI